MPIYEYKCDACGHELEALQKISDTPLKQCPECKDQNFRKKVSAAAFRLKGQGWYETDFKSGDKKNLAGEGEKASSGAESKPEAKSDAKGDNKTNSQSESKAGTEKPKGETKTGGAGKNESSSSKPAAKQDK